MAETDTGTPQLFVSHHSSKFPVAQQIEEALERRGVSCWIAPRDVDPGEPFDKSVRNAIENSAAILLLFCAKSDKSRHVKRELILGDSASRPIIPLRIEAVDPGELAYHLADSQWIDWIDRRDEVMDRVASQAQLYAGLPADAVPERKPSGAVIAGGSGGISRHTLAIGAGILSFLVAVVAVTWIIATSRAGDGEPAIEAAPVDAGAAESATAPLAGETETRGTDRDQPPASASAADDDPAQAPSPPIPEPAIDRAPEPRQPPATGPEPAPPQTSPQPIQRVISRCRGERSDAEYLLCANPELETRQRELAGIYRRILQRLETTGGDARSFQRAQRRWWDGVRGNCRTIGCLTNAQDQRIAQLRAIASGS